MSRLFLNLLKTPTCVGYLRLAVERNIAVVSNLFSPDGIVYYQPGQYCSNFVGRFPIVQDMEMVGIAWVCWCFPASIGCQICQQIQNSLFEDATISHDIARYRTILWSDAMTLHFLRFYGIYQTQHPPKKKTQTSPDVCDIYLFFDLHLGTWWTSYNPAVWAVAGPSGDFVVGNARSTRLYEEPGHGCHGLKISIEKGDCPIVSYSSSVVFHWNLAFIDDWWWLSP